MRLPLDKPFSRTERLQQAQCDPFSSTSRTLTQMAPFQVPSSRGHTGGHQGDVSYVLLDREVEVA